MKIVILSFLFCALLVIPQFQTDVYADDQYACVKKNNGQFRLVDDPEDCNPSEYSFDFEVKDDADLEGEICWTRKNAENCILKLNFKSAGSLFSFFGSEVCNSEEKHVYGSGFSDEGSNELNIGLTFTGLLQNGTGVSHEGKIFVMDLTDGFGLVQHRGCGEDPAPCIIEEEYIPIDCPE